MTEQELIDRMYQKLENEGNIEFGEYIAINLDLVKMTNEYVINKI
jgi:hypothetical protein